MKKASVWIAKRQGKKGTTYHVQYIVGGRVKTESAGRDSAKARAIAARIRTELNQGTYKNTRAITWDDFVAEHIALMEGSRSGTRTATIQALGNFQRLVKPATLLQIDYKMLETFKVRRGAEVKQTTANKDLRHLKAALNKAASRGYLTANPLAKQKDLFFKTPEPEITTVSHKEFCQMLAACNDEHVRAAAMLAFYAGMRAGEILALEWDDLNFDEGIISIRNKPDLHFTKSGQSREIPMSDGVRAALEPLQAGRLKSPLVFRAIFESGVTGDRPEIVHKIVAGLSQRIRKTFARAGLVNSRGTALYSIHDLRRSFATRLAVGGTNPKILSSLLGHSQASTTNRYYINAGMESKRQAIRLMTETA